MAKKNAREEPPKPQVTENEQMHLTFEKGPRYSN